MVAWPWQRRSGDPAEYVELPPPGEDLALPGERWCDVVHRRGRYEQQFKRLSDAQRDWSINDAITENLALPELLRDYMSQLADAGECEAAFEVLRSLTVCDPTVGSGAFLFAAIDVLEPLYSEVLARAEELEAEGKPVPRFLAETRTHFSSRYWLIKTICLRNLFGVDLMHEAPEIAKLRLFLKLAARIDRVDYLEPLPDLDFNIKCGNLLVGIADAEDAGGRLGDGRLDLGGEIAEIEALAAEMGESYDGFVAEQSQVCDSESADTKQALAARFDDARQRCHELLYSIRGTTPFEKWIESHQPFHWFVEFPSVWRNGGFDVVIGNPPYTKTSLVTGYTWVGYKTQKCPDLYAVCMERAAALLHDQGRFAMIVMHNLCFRDGFGDLRSHLEQSLSSLWVSAYAKRPDLLFAGSADVRNAILVGSVVGPNRFSVTRCNRWLSEARGRLFHTLEYSNPESSLFSCGRSGRWPLADPTIMAGAFAKLSRQGALDAGLGPSSDPATTLYFKAVCRYFLSAYVVRPPIVAKDGTLGVSPHDGVLQFREPWQRDVGLLMLTGRWAYLWWMMYGDEFHVTRSTLAAFPGDIERLTKRTPGDMEFVILLELSRTLQNEMPKHLAWQTNAGVKVGRYNMLKLRYITDRADWLFAKAWSIEGSFEAAGNLRDRMIFGNKE